MNTFSKLSKCAGEANVIYQRMKCIMECCMKTPEYDHETEYWDTEECHHHLEVTKQSAEELVEMLNNLLEELE